MLWACSMLDSVKWYPFYCGYSTKRFQVLLKELFKLRMSVQVIGYSSLDLSLVLHFYKFQQAHRATTLSSHNEEKT